MCIQNVIWLIKWYPHKTLGFPYKLFWNSDHMPLYFGVCIGEAFGG
ncbi:unnamed protein product [Brassica oleracea]